MQDYSRANKSPNLNRLLVLAEVLQVSELKRESLIRRRYEDRAIDYEVSLSFFELFNFVETTSGNVEPKDKFSELLAEGPIAVAKLKSLLVQQFLETNIKSELINNFLNLFSRTDEDLVLNLTTEERLKYSEIRNLFVELGMLEYLHEQDAYRVEPRLVPKVEEAISRARKAISAEQFAQVLASQERLGAEAELGVLKYEQARLKNHSSLVESIEHTARINVGAGYDILSWEEPDPESSNSERRHIEVKAVSPKDYRFMWTNNEIEQASKLQDKYYLYLVPVIGPNEFDIENVEIIRDPYKNVFLDKKVWSKSEKVYTIWKVGESNEESKRN